MTPAKMVGLLSAHWASHSTTRTVIAANTRSNSVPRHMAQFVGALQQWVEMARLEPIKPVKASGRGKGRSNNVVSARQGSGRTPARRGAEQVAAIRTWARAHGYTVAEKGRIPSEIEDAYNRQGSVPQSLSV